MKLFGIELWPTRTNKTEKQSVRKNILNILDRNNRVIFSIFIVQEKGNKLIVPQWERFIKWYHARPQSETFTFTYGGGLRAIQRRDIASYEIRLVNE